MKKYYRIVLLAVLAFSFGARAQQISLYSNYLLNSYAYNPAIAGAKPYVQTNLFARNQWTGFDGAPQTYMGSIYGPLKKMKNLAIGGMVVSDKTGLITTTSGFLSVSYHVKLSKKLKLGMGLSGGVNQFKVRLYDVRAYDQGDELLTGNILTANTPDANAGLYLYSEKFFLGISDLHMLDNKIKFKTPLPAQGRVTPHYYGVIGYNFNAGKHIIIQPSILLKQNLPTKVQPEYNLKLIYNNIFWIGSTYRTDDAVVFMAGVTVIKKLNIAYSFDYSITSIKKYNQGSHEIMLNYNFIKKKKDDKDEEEFKIIDNSMHQSIKNKKDTRKEEAPKEEAPKEEKKQD